MYEKYYGFSKEPFDLNLDPRFFFLTKNLKEAWNSLIYGITNRKGFILVTGDKGIGKTTLIGLLHLYFAITNPKIKIIPVFRPYYSVEEYIEEILRQSQIPVMRRAKSYMISQFNHFLMEGSAKGETLAIMFDETQNLSNEILEELRLLANQNARAGNMIQEIFVGEPHIGKRLESNDLKQLRQRMAMRVDLKPLTKEESRQYMEYRLNGAGSNLANVFTPQAEDLIFRHSRGNPMIMNRICDMAFCFGYTQGRKKIDRASVKEAIQKMEKEGTQESRLGREPASGRRKYFPRPVFPKSLFYPAVAGACLGLALFMGGIVGKISPGEKPAPGPSAWFGVGRNHFVDPILPLLKAIWPWADDDPFLHPKGEGKVVFMQPGDSLSGLAKQFYGADNLTILDYILQRNPEAANPQKIQAHQKIVLPAITGDSPVLKYAGGIYKIWLGTFLSPEEAGSLRDDPAFQGGEIEVIPQKSPTGPDWYRVVWGKFHSEKEISGILQTLKEKGKLPIFEGSQEKGKMSKRGKEKSSGS
jgi:general secretion pathway protein A